MNTRVKCIFLCIYYSFQQLTINVWDYNNVMFSGELICCSHSIFHPLVANNCTDVQMPISHLLKPTDMSFIVRYTSYTPASTPSADPLTKTTTTTTTTGILLYKIPIATVFAFYMTMTRRDIHEKHASLRDVLVSSNRFVQFHSAQLNR